MNKKKLLTKILFFLFFLWIAISLLRTFYNFSKLATEERKWYGLSDEQKRVLQFGDLHSFFRFIQSHTKNRSTILFFTDDAKAYYLGRYYLYPTKVIGKFEPILWNSKKQTYDYIVIYPLKDKHLLENKSFQWSGIEYRRLLIYRGSTGVTGIIFKK